VQTSRHASGPLRLGEVHALDRVAPDRPPTPPRLQELRGHFHALRQSAIDEELFDVVAGFEALQRR
jgi:hypothetical protein